MLTAYLLQPSPSTGNSTIKFLAWSLHYCNKNEEYKFIFQKNNVEKQAVTRDNEVVINREPRQQSLLRVQSGKHKAAKMTISVVFDKWGVNNERWARTLQMYSDYLIRY